VALDHRAHREGYDQPTRGPAMTDLDTFPDSPTVRAVLVRSEWGHYRASLTLPGGRTRTMTSDQLDGARAQVIDMTRAYLAAEVGHPGRLQVEDPEGRWLLAVPHDGEDLVPLSEPLSAPPLNPRPPARKPVLPSRPAVPGRRAPATRSSVRRSPSLSSRRVVAGAALAAAVLVVAGIVELTHNTSSPRRPPAATRPAHDLTRAHITTAPVTTAPRVPRVTPVTSPSSPRAAVPQHPKPKPRRSPRTRHHPSPAKRTATVRHASAVAPSTTSTSTSTPVQHFMPARSGRSTSSHFRGGGGIRLPVRGGPPPL
jgi:hypothetical protein